MNYLQEWRSSCVDDQLTRLNVTALADQDPYEYLLYSDNLPRRNDGRVGNYILKRYQHLRQGGWWCSGIDILTGQDDLWGCFKPKKPVASRSERKLVKYEHPPKTPTSLFALRPTVEIWRRIGDRYQIPVRTEDIKSDRSDLGFWEWVENHPDIPLCITEGAKKAGALLTAGYAAIALPGVHSGYRVPRDEQGNRIGQPRLIPQLQQLAAKERPIYLAFDCDSKPETVKAVSAAIRQTGYLFKQQGCSVKVITWNPTSGKGVDDLIAAGGQEAFDQVYQTAPNLDTWKALFLSRLTHRANLQVHRRYLGNLPIDCTAQLIAIKSPKGTGKSQLLEGIVAQALAQQQRVLVVGHRIRLVEALCQRFGLNYITELRDTNLDSVVGYGLCLDSLHPNSQAQFQAADWSDGVVIIDEVEQVLWHGLESSTCSHNRVAILKSLKTLMQNVLGGEGQVFIADADLSDISIDYLVSLSGVRPKLFIIENEWKPGVDESWQVHNYPDSNPERLVRDLEQHIKEGGKPFVCLSAQKLTSQWGTCALEAYLQKQFPRLRILRIDAESLADPAHAAYGCMTSLEQVLGNYDVVLASPAIETGVSIELQGHFTSVWGIALGVQSENSVRQALARIRENLPRFIWVANYGFNQVGNGATSIPALLTASENLTQLNIRLLQQSDFEALDDLETGFQAESLLCWAKMAVRLNASMLQYRDSVLGALRGEGHQVVDVPAVSAASALLEAEESGHSLVSAIKAVGQQNYQIECEAIAMSADLADSEYRDLKKQLVKTTMQRRRLRKYELQRRYGCTVTAELVAKDDGFAGAKGERGWYSQLQLHYFLTCGREHLRERDATAARRLIEQGDGNIFLPDFNRCQLGASIGMMEVLGIPVLLGNLARELKNTDEDLRAMAAIAHSHRSAIKSVLGIGLAKNASAIEIVRRLLGKIGYGLKCVRRVRATPTEQGKRQQVRVYQAIAPNDERFEVFQYWLSLGGQLPIGIDDWRDDRTVDGNYPVKATKSRVSRKDAAVDGYVQLCLAV